MTVDRYEWIGPEFRRRATTQSYDAQAKIEGVQVFDLRLFSDEGSDFCELTRFAADGAFVQVPEYRPAQISYSLMQPGAIKAWHLHQQQDDLWFVPPHGRVLVGLVDVREQSPTYQSVMRLTVGVGTPHLLFIPRGVAHGVANLTTHPVSVFYFATANFDPTCPDEHRLPYDVIGPDFWSIRPG